MQNIFKTRDYSQGKFSHYLTERDCTICNKTFKVPKHHVKVITTCCLYCQNVALVLKKNKGKYLLCQICDKPIWAQPRKSPKYCGKKCLNLANSIIPKENSLKLLKTGKKKYYGPNWENQRRKTRERDNYSCQSCGITEKDLEKELSVHHKTPFVYFDDYLKANQLSNLISLCEPCHRKEHSGKNHHYHFDPEKIVYKDKPRTVMANQQAKAKEVLELLLKTNKTLKEISDITDMSYSRVKTLYDGKSWKGLYENPPYMTNPRAKVKFKKA